MILKHTSQMFIITMFKKIAVRLKPFLDTYLYLLRKTRNVFLKNILNSCFPVVWYFRWMLKIFVFSRNSVELYYSIGENVHTVILYSINIFYYIFCSQVAIKIRYKLLQTQPYLRHPKT